MASEGSSSSTTVDFSGLILGFSSAALYYMGESAIEGRQGGAKNIPLAKQNIDIILMLRDKTQGNLSQDEERLIQQLLADLQLKLIESARHP